MPFEIEDRPENRPLAIVYVSLRSALDTLPPVFLSHVLSPHDRFMLFPVDPGSYTYADRCGMDLRVENETVPHASRAMYSDVATSVRINMQPLPSERKAPLPPADHVRLARVLCSNPAAFRTFFLALHRLPSRDPGVSRLVRLVQQLSSRLFGAPPQLVFDRSDYAKGEIALFRAKHQLVAPPSAPLVVQSVVWPDDLKARHRRVMEKLEQDTQRALLESEMYAMRKPKRARTQSSEASDDSGVTIIS